MNNITSSDRDIFYKTFNPSCNTVTVKLGMLKTVPRQVIYNGPATVVIWEDGTKTVVRCHEEDVFDEEKGFLLCCAKKLMGNTGSYNDHIAKHVPLGGRRAEFSTFAKAVADTLWKEIKEVE